MRPWLRAIALVLLTTPLLGATCGQDFLSILPGVVNDPKNLSLRRSILAYGTSRLCAEMQRRSVPLKLNDGDPIIGRFYPTSCFSQELANDNLFVQFRGHGYAWTNLTRRMAFEAEGAVEYDHDFQMHGDTMYVYFRQRSTSAAQFKAGMIEQPQAAAVAGVSSPTGATYANAFGAQIMKNEIARGFTVIREESGAVQFGLGVVERGQRPTVPYRVTDSGRVLLANERTEVHQNQRDYAGPFEVSGGGDALYLTVAVEGAPAVDVQILPRGAGEAWLQQYTRSATPGPPPAAPMLDEPVFSGAVWKRVFPVPEGLYYVVFDNTAAAGRTQPTSFAFDDRAVLVSFAVEVGDAP